MPVASSYTFADSLWTLFIFFAWVIWFWILITVFSDLFRRHDTSGFSKVLWIIFVIVLPYIGVFVYLIAEHQGMAERSQKQIAAAQSHTDAYIRSVAASTDPSDQITKAKQLLDAGTITQAEFDQLKQKALTG